MNLERAPPFSTSGGPDARHGVKPEAVGVGALGSKNLALLWLTRTTYLIDSLFTQLKPVLVREPGEPILKNQFGSKTHTHTTGTRIE